MNVHLAIDDTKRALSRCRAALTTLGEAPATPARRLLIVTLHEAIGALEEDLRALRYQAQHPQVTA